MRYHLKLGIITIFLGNSVTYASENPNIIILYGDDIGYGDLGCYGGTGVQTPNIDALAGEGVRFLSGYCAAATCTPSRYSLLTGEYAFRNQSAQVLPGNAPLIIDPARPSLPSFLQKNGYVTGLVGKWHLGLGTTDHPLDWNGKIAPGPLDIGFNYAFFMAATADRVPSVYIENDHIVNLDPSDPIQVNYENPVGDEATGLSNPEMLKVQADKQHAGTIVNGISRIGWMTGGQSARFKDEDMADTYLRHVIDFISNNRQKPFFLYYAPNECHVPRVPHQRFVHAGNMGLRGTALATFDWCVGRVVEALKVLGIYENTMIIISSDNGPVLFDGYSDGAIERVGTHRPAGPWRGGKYSCWEGGTRVPFIVSWPKRINPGISDAQISQVDLFASFAALLGLPLPDGAANDGENILSALLGESGQGRDYIIEEAFKQIAIRKGIWKYIPPGSVIVRGGLDEWIREDVHEPGVLFNLEEDPGETTDRSAMYPATVTELRNILRNVTFGKN